MSCLFCMIIEKKISSKFVFEDENIIAINDIHPQAPLHVLIIPKQHIATIADITGDHAKLIGDMVVIARSIASNNIMCESGYRLVFNVNSFGGQEVYHLHLHLLAGRQMHWPPG